MMVALCFGERQFKLPLHYVTLKVIIGFLRDQEYRELLLTTLIVLLIGTVGFCVLEGWTG